MSEMTSVHQNGTSKRQASNQQTEVTPSITSPLLSNTRGLPSLADEIYLEILSYFPAFPIPVSRQERDSDNDIYGHRRLTLDALARTCRTLRRVFHPYQWECIEVYDHMDLGRGPLDQCCYRKGGKVFPGGEIYATELLRQLEIVTVRNSSLAERIKVLDVVIVSCSAKSLLPELARCMAIMPNLHTVQLDFDVDVSQRELIGYSFAPYTYPQIRTACATADGHQFLFSCPKAKHISVLSHAWYEIRQILENIVSHCSSVETLGPINLANQRFSLGLFMFQVSQFKNLREFTLKLTQLPTDDDMKPLWKMANLQTIRFTIIATRLLPESEIEEWKLRMEEWLSRTPQLSEGVRKELIVTIGP